MLCDIYGTLERLSGCCEFLRKLDEYKRALSFLLETQVAALRSLMHAHHRSATRCISRLVVKATQRSLI